MSVDCTDKSLLMAYLYDECEPEARRAFEAHVAECAACAAEVADLRGVREALSEWTPPEQALGFRLVRAEAPASRRWWSLPAVPAWAQAVAAVLLLAVGAAIANVDVQVGTSGVTIRTGWHKTAAPVAATAPMRQGPGTASLTPTAHVTGPEPWQADLAGLEQRLRHDFSVSAASGTLASAATAAAPGDNAEWIRRVQALIDKSVDQSEHRQQQAYEGMLAVRMVQLARDLDSQRRADLVRIQQGMGQIEGRTSSEVAQQREMIRALLRNVNIQEIK